MRKLKLRKVGIPGILQSWVRDARVHDMKAIPYFLTGIQSLPGLLSFIFLFESQ